MPQRFLKPGINNSMNFNACSDAAQNVFVRLLSEVDDYALFDAHPQQLAGVLYPLGKPIGRPVKPERMQEWLNELAERHMILLYKVAGKPFLHLLRWTERNRLVKPSRFPPPPAGSCPCKVCFENANLLASDSRCQQPLADASGCCQLTTNAASPSPSPSPSPSDHNKNGSGSESQSRLQYSALAERVKKASDKAKRGELGDLARLSLKKMSAALEELQKKQARGDFSLMDLKEFGI